MDKKKRLSDDIAEMLLSMIVVEKKYLPGDKLPNEIELSKELGVSRITLREAIRILVTRHVLEIKNEIEDCITNKKSYAKQEMLFHCSIAQATHNEFMSRLEPVLQESIQKGVFLYEYEHVSNQDIISDNKMIMEFMNDRNAEGARSAMRIHILRAINQLKLEKK